MIFEGVIDYIVIDVVHFTSTTGKVYLFSPISEGTQTAEVGNSTFSQMEGNPFYFIHIGDHVFEIYNSAALIIRRCDFTDITSYNKGAVIFAGQSNVIVTITGSNFEKNFAAFGGVIYSERDNTIT
jgi:predicted outer membrane repeat protein